MTEGSFSGTSTLLDRDIDHLYPVIVELHLPNLREQKIPKPEILEMNGIII